MTPVVPLRAVFAPLVLTVLAAGCAVGPDYERPDLDTPVPAQWANPAAADAQAHGPTMVDALPDSGTGAAWRWWEAFGDTTLDQLVDDALTHNHQLEQAVARVLEARAGVTGAESARWPAVEVGGQAARTKTSEKVVIFGPVYNNAYGVTATARWELDLWGKLSRAKEAAVATLLASEQNRRAVAQGLIADVVRTWLLVRELQLQVALTERTIASFENSLTMVQERYRRGLVGPLDLHLAGQNLAAARAQLPAFRQRLVAARRTLEILAGRYPAGTLKASDLDRPDGRLAAELMPAPLAPVPAGLPSELLDRRPDLLAAESRLAATVAQIGQAKAALYPRIALTAEGGTRSREFADLFTTGSDAWSLVGNLLMPLINRGATKAQIQAAEARAREATAAYRAAVLQAFAEVENALDQDLLQQERETQLAESADRAQRSVELAEERYRRGLDNLLTTLESQRRLFTAESSLLATQRERRTARVDLIQALGGPWETAPEAALSMTSTREGDRP
jgi:multidrug efflux system outer membrane protein